MIPGYGSGSINERLYRAAYSRETWSSSNRSFSRGNYSSSVSDNIVDIITLKQRLETNFRPLFQGFVYGGEQITNTELRQHLLEHSYRRLLPRDKLHVLMDLVDYNPQNSITYAAFVKIVTGEDKSESGFPGSDSSSSLLDPDSVGPLYDVCRNTTPPQDLLEFASKHSWLPPPVFILLVTCVQIIVFIVYAVQMSNAGTPVSALDGVSLDNPVVYNPARRYEVWRFITYAFLHQGYVDLILTILLQIFICFPVEIVFSTWRLVILYFFGVIAGSLLHSISDHYTGLVGGSGGTYCIIAAHFVAMMYNWRDLKKTDDRSCKRVVCHPGFRMFVLLLLVVIQTGLGVYRRFFAPNILKMGIGHYGGGLFGGIMLTEAFLKNRKRYPWQTDAGWMNLFFMLIFGGGCAMFNILYRGYPPTDYS